TISVALAQLLVTRQQVTGEDLQVLEVESGHCPLASLVAAAEMLEQRAQQPVIALNPNVLAGHFEPGERLPVSGTDCSRERGPVSAGQAQLGHLARPRS